MPVTLKKPMKHKDVELLQQKLNENGAQPKLSIDGDFGQKTENAVKAFQIRNKLLPDGIVGQQTWTKLGVSQSPTPTETKPADVSDPNATFCFPFPVMPSKPWTTGGRYFGASRNNGKRKHAGCDLLFPTGTIIYAVADGELVRGPYHFYSGTDAVEIRHGKILVGYGEIAKGSYTGGKTITKGQPIAKVGRLESGSSMLHIEIYTNGASTTSLSGAGIYKRRSDVTDPAPYLDEWKKNLPKPGGK